MSLNFHFSNKFLRQKFFTSFAMTGLLSLFFIGSDHHTAMATTIALAEEEAENQSMSAVRAVRSASQALREVLGGERQEAHTPASTPARVFQEKLLSEGKFFLASTVEELAVQQAAEIDGNADESSRSTVNRGLAAGAAQTVIASGLASAKASGVAPLAHLELELFPVDETGWGIEASTLFPLWESEERHHTAFTQLSFRKDKEEFVSTSGERSLISDKAVSAGFAYRNYSEERSYLWGVNSFVDSDTDRHWRASLGFDMDWGIFGLSANYYHALSSWQDTVPGFESRVRGGVDLEARGRVRPLDGTELGLRAFRWNGDEDLEDISGLEVSARYRPVSLIGFNGSYSFHDGDLPLWQVGVSLIYQMGLAWEEQVRRLTYEERVDLRELRHTKVRRESQMILQERVKSENAATVASLKGTMSVSHSRGTSNAGPGERFPVPATVFLSSGAGDVAALSLGDGAALAVGSGTSFSMTARNVALINDGFLRYRSGSAKRTLSMPGVSILLHGTEVELRREGGENTIGVLDGEITVRGAGYSASVKRGEILDVATGKKLIGQNQRQAHINASASLIDGPSLRASAWSAFQGGSGLPPGGNPSDGGPNPGPGPGPGPQPEPEPDPEPLPGLEVRLSASGSHIIDLGNFDGHRQYETSEHMASSFIVKAALFENGIPVTLSHDVQVTLAYSGDAKGADVSGQVANILIPAGSQSKSAAMNVVNDSTTEWDEEFIVRAVSATGGASVGGLPLMLTIYEDDNALLAPNASACDGCGTQIAVKSGQTVVLDSSKSKPGIERTIASHFWSQFSGPVTIPLQNANSSKASFVAPTLQNSAFFTFEVVVTDNRGVSRSAFLDVRVDP